MIFKLLAIGIVTVGIAAVGGCKKQAEPVEPAAPAEVKVTEENLDSELDKMEEQIEADLAAE